MIEPGDIKDEIKKRPPLQREDALRHYQGLHVNWEVKFKGSAGYASNAVRTEPPGPMTMYPDVYFEVPEKDRARVHLLHEDAPLWIEGEIEKVENNGLQIYLKVNKVLFDKDEPSHMQTSKLGGDTFNITQVHNGNGDQMIHSGKQAPRTPSKKWYEKPAGKLVLGVIVALIAAGIIYYLGWN